MKTHGTFIFAEEAISFQEINAMFVRSRPDADKRNAR